MKPQLDLRLDLLLIRHLGVVYKGPSTCVWRLVTRSGVLEALDDRRLAAPVVAYDDRDGGEELDDGNVFVIERAYAPDSKLVEVRH